MKMEGNTEQSTEKYSNWSSSDHRGSGKVRSYTCTFCKRGFSNAQALGGHMNIHRRDRAKLRQSPGESSLSLDTPKSSNPSEIPYTSDDKSLILSESSEELISCCTPKRVPRTPGSKDDGEELLRALPFFDDKPSPRDCGEAASSSGRDDAKKKMEESHGLSQTELDLELRLGSEPHKTATKSTAREFF